MPKYSDGSITDSSVISTVLPLPDVSVKHLLDIRVTKGAEEDKLLFQAFILSNKISQKRQF